MPSVNHGNLYPSQKWPKYEYKAYPKFIAGAGSDKKGVIVNTAEEEESVRAELPKSEAKPKLGLKPRDNA